MANQSVNIPSIVNKPVNFQQNMPANITSMQGVDTEKIKQSVDHSYLANRARASEEANPAAVLGLTGATWYGISQGMDRLNPKFAGEFQHSWLGKLGRWGDKI